MLLKCLVSSVFLGMVVLMQAGALSAQVVELGESQLHGKKDQPEAMTILSLAPLDESEELVEWKVGNKIQDEISRDIFKLSLKI